MQPIFTSHISPTFSSAAAIIITNTTVATINATTKNNALPPHSPAHVRILTSNKANTLPSHRRRRHSSKETPAVAVPDIIAGQVQLALPAGGTRHRQQQQPEEGHARHAAGDAPAR